MIYNMRGPRGFLPSRRAREVRGDCRRGLAWVRGLPGGLQGVQDLDTTRIVKIVSSQHGWRVHGSRTRPFSRYHCQSTPIFLMSLFGIRTPACGFCCRSIQYRFIPMAFCGSLSFVIIIQQSLEATFQSLDPDSRRQSSRLSLACLVSFQSN